VDLQPSLVKYAYMKTLKQRTEEAIAEGFTVGQLAAAAGKTSAAASLWLSGATKTIKADTAIGLEKLTGWRWEWWVTGKGERGATKKSRVGSAEPSSLAVGIVELARVLAQNLPADVRRDAAYLLQQLAEFGAVDRHRQGLIDLLEPFAVNDSPTTETRGTTTASGERLDLDHAMSERPAEHAPAVTNEGDVRSSEEKTKWGAKSKNSPPIKEVDTTPKTPGKQAVLQEPAAKKPGGRKTK
jgi:hypothetical protein